MYIKGCNSFSRCWIHFQLHMHSRWPNACVSTRSWVPKAGSGEGRSWDGTNHRKKWRAIDPGFSWETSNLSCPLRQWSLESGILAPEQGLETSCLSLGTAAFPTPAVSSLPALFCSLFKNCDKGGFEMLLATVLAAEMETDLWMAHGGRLPAAVP